MRLRGLTLFLSQALLVAVCSEQSQRDAGSKHSKKGRHVPDIAIVDEDDVYFEERFPTTDSLKRWKTSSSKKADASDDIAKYDGKWGLEVPQSSTFDNDLSLALKSVAKHHAISAFLDRPFDFGNASKFVMQYEVKFQNSPECSGAYVKLLTNDPSMALEQFNDRTPYTIMFGPDKCGMNQKCHFILRFRNPVTGAITEHHSKRAGDISQGVFTDQQTHLYRLELTGNKYKVYVDGSLQESGDLLKDLEPALIPPATIDDPVDKKPDDWDEREMIPDEKAVKPDDWDEDAPLEIPDETQKKPDYWLDDEPALIPDENATMPDDYDEEIDGKWEPPLVDNPKCIRDGETICGEWKQPLIPNPKYKGKWMRPSIKNPNYKGVWKPRQIPNPEHFKIDTVFANISPIGAIGLELWSMTDQILFDNFIIAGNSRAPDKFMKLIWKEKSKSELPKSSGKFESFMNRAAKRPYLYATIVIAIFLPTVYIIGMLTKPKPKPVDVGVAKKTDATTPDEKEDLVPSGDDVAFASEKEEDEASTVKPRKRTKSKRRDEDEAMQSGNE